MDEEIDLEIIDDNVYNDNLEVLEYPCLVLYGVTTEAELTYFRSRIVDDSVACPLYGDLDGQKFKMGMLELTLESLLSLRRISNYQLILMKSQDISIKIDLNNANTLMSFIRL